MPADFRFEEHTADVRLCGRGDDPGEAVTGCLLGLLAVIFDRSPAPLRDARLGWEPWCSDHAEDELALVELLGEALFRVTARGEAVLVLRGGPRAGTLGVAALLPGWRVVREVKAVTYNEPLLECRTAGGWEARVTLDL